MNYNGEDILSQSLIAGSKEACAFQCVKSYQFYGTSCPFWTYTENTKACVLQDSDQGRTASVGDVSGQRECGSSDDCTPENDINYVGNDIMSTSTDTIVQCAFLCRRDTACKFWTYEASDKTCTLRTSDTGRTIYIGRTSGQRSCGEKGKMVA